MSVLTRLRVPAVLAALPLVALAARWEGKDITFDVRTRSEFTTADGAEQVKTNITRVMASGNKTRSERVPQEDDPQEMPSIATLLLNGGRSILSLDNTHQSYFRFDTPEGQGKEGAEDDENFDVMALGEGMMVAMKMSLGAASAGGEFTTVTAIKSSAGAGAVEVGSVVVAAGAGEAAGGEVASAEAEKKAAVEKERVARSRGGAARGVGKDGAARSMEVGRMKFERPEVSNVSVAVEKVGEGPTIEGFPTEHYRMRQTATVKAKVGEQTQLSTTETTTDYYYSSDLQAMLAPYTGVRRVTGGMSAVQPMMGAMMADMAMMRPGHSVGQGAVVAPRGALEGMVMQMPMINPSRAANMDTAMVKAMRTERAKLPKGTPMKTVVESKVTTEGQLRTTVTTTSIENVRKVDLPASTWEVPEGYTNRTPNFKMERGSAPPIKKQD